MKRLRFQSRQHGLETQGRLGMSGAGIVMQASRVREQGGVHGRFQIRHFRRSSF